MSTDTVDIWCLLITHEKNLVGEGNALPVRVSSEETVAHLKKGVKKEKENHLKVVDSDDLTVWKLKDPALCSDSKLLNEMKETVQDIDLGNKAEKLGEMDSVRNLKGFLLLVQMPGAYFSLGISLC